MQGALALKRETKELTEMRSLMGVYEDLSATRAQKIRALILTARDFYEALAQISDEVGTDFERMTGETGRISAVFVAANSGLYGDIIDRTFRQFLEYVRKNPADVYVAGKMGESLMAAYAPNIKYVSLPLSDDLAAPGEFDKLVTTLLPHKKVLVFFGKFYNIAIQHPSQTVISGEVLPQTKDPRTLAKKRLQYLYEPSVYAVSEIFAKDIMGSIMEQTFREAQLARQASRLMQLDDAVVTINTKLKSLGFRQRRLHKRQQNRKQNLVESGLIARRRS